MNQYIINCIEFAFANNLFKGFINLGESGDVESVCLTYNIPEEYDWILEMRHILRKNNIHVNAVEFNRNVITWRRFESNYN